ncbi:uncharacterized protein LOC108673001, partial [Hyalella azteca]|uniref:Uncharacterized protein LOC108673001 n=1 Tax=Hyalella azteca TaxID=294128 RepID=A0A8B7NRE2_HYAAZ
MSQASDSPGALRHALLQAVGGASLPPPSGGDVIKSRVSPGSRDAVFGGPVLSGGGPESIMAAVPGLQLGLVALALLILVLGLGAILYICVHWARAVRQREKACHVVLRAPFMRVPPAAPSTTDTLHQLYETQVLHMSVPLDDDSLGDQPSPHHSSTHPSTHPSTHHYYMDNVSYISKNNNRDDSRSDAGPPSPWVSRPSTSRGFSPPTGLPHLLPHSHGYLPQHNSDADSEDDVPGRQYSPSVTNTNVVFGRRYGDRDGRH